MGSTSEALESEARAADTVVVGVVVRPHGVRGELKIEIQSDNPKRFEPGSDLLLALPHAPPRRVRVEAFRGVRGGGLLVLEGYETRDQAEELRGARLEVDVRDVPPAPPGLYYHYELVGCRCVTAEGEELGRVVEVVEDGGGHLLRLRRGSREVLVPFVEAFLKRLDVAARRIEVSLPPGLVEICASES